ncbi:hypothetical protein L228DRAFT_286116 [Xylona heveae TC161]|uniref:Uncharacterized protein n=1 Tax=Xylona heveae (strain CBS 132557 / TC161) TaxID=1328760 RepID=A0A164ZM64_XYLHT|nr:hypothetical protein L228DRAFT_286116 [Xylona heveae TC161]KZF19268.1 hypothetical protein L228DRAFT_286116 [Xylona heveae TC161]
MAKKRKSSSDGAEAAPSNKRSRQTQGDHGDNSRSNNQPRTDPTTGLRSAFPGLDDYDGGELFYGPANDGLEYLRMVRAEARGVPNLLIAPNPSGEIRAHTFAGPHGGYYSDGAYTALPVVAGNSAPLHAKEPPAPAPIADPQAQDQNGEFELNYDDDEGGELADSAAGNDYPAEEVEEEEEEIYYDEAAEEYYNDNNNDNEAMLDSTRRLQAEFDSCLCTRFRLRKQNLHSDPPASAIAALDDNHPISLPSGSRIAYSQWRRLVRSTDPNPVQLASMDQSSVLRLIKLLTPLMLKRGKHISKRLSVWTWSLLCRLEDVGCLSSEEVSVVRDLGKRAVWVKAGLKRNPDGSIEFANDLISNRDGQSHTGDASDDESGLEYEETGQEKAEEEDESEGVHGESNETNNERDIDEEYEPPEAEPLDGNQVHSNEPYEPGQDNDPSHLKSTESDSDPDLAAAKARLLAQLPPDSQTQNASQVHQVPPSLPPLPSPLKSGDTISGHVPGIAPQDDISKEVDDDDDDDDDDKNTQATIDMILVIVGEYYGQRDLLEFRDVCT